jgi:hypothetical protein
MELWITLRLLPSETCPVIRSPAPVSAVPMARLSVRSARTENGASMSTIIFDQLLPYLGAEGATYWAQLLMVDPV